MAAAQRADTPDSKIKDRLSGPAHNADQTNETNGQTVFLELSTNTLVQRPRGRPTSKFLQSHREVTVPPGQDPEDYVRRLLDQEQGRKRVNVKVKRSGTDKRPRAPQTRGPETSPQAATPDDRSSDTTATSASPAPGTPDVGRAPTAGPDLTVPPVSEDSANQNIGARSMAGPQIEDAELLRYLRTRVDELTSQRDTWWEIYQQEVQHNQQEINALLNGFHHVFEVAESDIRTLHQQMALSIQGEG